MENLVALLLGVLFVSAAFLLPWFFAFFVLRWLVRWIVRVVVDELRQQGVL